MTKNETSDNQVYLRGRLAAVPALRELPSGDVLAIFRVTVDRPPQDRVRVDSIDCVTMYARARNALARASAGDGLEVHGSLRRRFWRTPAGPASRYAVDARTVRVIKTGRRGAASRVRKPASE